MNLKHLKNFLIFWMVLIIIPLCKQEQRDTSQKEKNLMVVTFVSGDVKIIRVDEQGNQKEIPAQIGMFVYENDSIKTEKGKIDLQSKTGSSVRIKEMTFLSIKSISSNTGGETNINLENGNMMANIKKATAKEDFKVTTPTSIAGVRGTIFTVEVDPFEKTSSVKVLEGKVALNPRIVLLENVSKEEVNKNPQLQKLKELESKETIIEANQEGKLNPVVEKKIIQLNDKTQDTKNIESISESELLKEIVKKVDDKVDFVKVENIEPTPELIIDKETMVVLNQEELKQIDDTKNLNEILARKQEELKIKEEEVIKKIESMASTKQLKSENEIKSYYNKLEIITLRNGTKISGAVIAQTGDVLVIHTTKGVIRIKKDQVESQEFK